MSIRPDEIPPRKKVTIPHGVLPQLALLVWKSIREELCPLRMIHAVRIASDLWSVFFLFSMAGLIAFGQVVHLP